MFINLTKTEVEETITALEDIQTYLEENGMLHLNDYALQEAPFGRNDSKNQKEIYETIKECMKAVEEQPTAFDVDNIVSNLEQLKLDGACNNEDCVYCKYLNECWDGDMSEEHAIDMAIEIVKRGGLDES